MIGIDTSIMIRYIVQDDPDQSRLATKFLESRLSRTSPGFLSIIVMCEICWVLKRAYKYKKSIIARVIRQMLNSEDLIVENSEYIWEALKAYENGNADFSDYLIGYGNHHQGCSLTVTFDKNAADEAHFRLITEKNVI
ncbi:type II toxin-antitoxin system VapC family toxin [bacterium]|nr:type II toxin-antitoxin system VapC family toxin [bacterium]